jgi:hypothetical protein
MPPMQARAARRGGPLGADGRQAAQRWAAGRRSALEAMSLYGGNVRTKLKLSAGLPNRRAVGAAQRCAAGCALDSALGARGQSDAQACKAHSHLTADIYGLPNDGSERQAAQRWAAGAVICPQGYAVYAGHVRTKLKLSAHGCQIAGPWGRPSDARRAAPSIPRLVRGEMQHPTKTPISLRLLCVPYPMTGREEKAAQRWAAGR